MNAQSNFVRSNEWEASNRYQIACGSISGRNSTMNELLFSGSSQIRIDEVMLEFRALCSKCNVWNSLNGCSNMFGYVSVIWFSIFWFACNVIRLMMIYTFQICHENSMAVSICRICLNVFISRSNFKSIYEQKQELAHKSIRFNGKEFYFLWVKAYLKYIYGRKKM